MYIGWAKYIGRTTNGVVGWVAAHSAPRFLHLN